MHAYLFSWCYQSIDTHRSGLRNEWSAHFALNSKHLESLAIALWLWCCLREIVWLAFTHFVSALAPYVIGHVFDCSPTVHLFDTLLCSAVFLREHTLTRQCSTTKYPHSLRSLPMRFYFGSAHPRTLLSQATLVHDTLLTRNILVFDLRLARLRFCFFSLIMPVVNPHSIRRSTHFAILSCFSAANSSRFDKRTRQTSPILF